MNILPNTEPTLWRKKSTLKELEECVTTYTDIVFNLKGLTVNGQHVYSWEEIMAIKEYIDKKANDE